MRRAAHIVTAALLLAVVVTVYPRYEQVAVPASGGAGLFTESAVLDTSQVEAGYQPPVRIGRKGH